jgi:SAM-dependent methyltransferase
MTTIRDYDSFDGFLNELMDDVYPQPTDDGHVAMSLNIINKWIPKLLECTSVVDMGCGQIAPQEEFEKFGIRYLGVAIGEDVVVARGMGKSVVNLDMTFTGFDSESFDLVYARHTLEHSPFPLLTLMEWHRIARHWLLVVLPSPSHYGWEGKNHYGVMNYEQARAFMERAGWHVIWDDVSEPTEIRLMCEKVKRQ